MKRKLKLLIPSLSVLTTSCCLSIVSCGNKNEVVLIGGSTALSGFVGERGADTQGAWKCMLQGEKLAANILITSINQQPVHNSIQISNDGYIYWDNLIPAGVYQFQLKATTVKGTTAISPIITLNINNKIVIRGGCSLIESIPNVGGYDKGVWKIYDGETPIEQSIKIKCTGETKSFDNIYFDNGRLGWSKDLPIGTYTFQLSAEYKKEKLTQDITLSIRNHSDSNCFKWIITDFNKRRASIFDFVETGTNNLIIPQSVDGGDGTYTINAIEDGSFIDKQSIKNVIIPDSIKKIGSSAFSHCYNLESVELPSDLIEIPNSCFNTCQLLTSIKIPKSIKKIGKLAFESTGLNCIDLTDWGASNFLNNIENNAFYDISTTGTIVLAEGATTLQQWKDVFSTGGLNIDGTNWKFVYR